MEMTQTTFNEVRADAGGIVILGCDVSTQENRDGFMNGVFDFLQGRQVIPTEAKIEDIFESIQYAETTGGRHDIIYVVKPGSEFNFGRMAMVRLTMGDCCWIEDWLVNYAGHYGEEPRGPHAKGFIEGEEGDE